MNRLLAALSAAALIVSVGVANAAESHGKIKSIDPAKSTLTLEDGTMYQLAKGVSTKGLKAGQEVTVMFETKNGKHMASKVEAKM